MVVGDVMASAFQMSYFRISISKTAIWWKDMGIASHISTTSLSLFQKVTSIAKRQGFIFTFISDD